MKNFWIGMLALMLGFCVVSCKENPNKDDKAKAESEQVEEKVDLADIVAKAKAESANWTADEWKENMKKAMIAVAPSLQKVSEMMKHIGDDPQKAAEALGKLQSLQEEFAPMEKLMDELDSICNASEIGKAVMEDTVWANQMKKELGIPDDI